MSADKRWCCCMTCGRAGRLRVRRDGSWRPPPGWLDLWHRFHARTGREHPRGEWLKLCDRCHVDAVIARRR